MYWVVNNVRYSGGLGGESGDADFLPNNVDGVVQY